MALPGWLLLCVSPAYGMFGRPTLVFHGAAALLAGATRLWRNAGRGSGAAEPPSVDIAPGPGAGPGRSCPEGAFHLQSALCCTPRT
jgi:hypothetical protein